MDAPSRPSTASSSPASQSSIIHDHKSTAQSAAPPAPPAQRDQGAAVPGHTPPGGLPHPCRRPAGGHAWRQRGSTVGQPGMGGLHRTVCCSRQRAKNTCSTRGRALRQPGGPVQGGDACCAAGGVLATCTLPSSQPQAHLAPSLPGPLPPCHAQNVPSLQCLAPSLPCLTLTHPHPHPHPPSHAQVAHTEVLARFYISRHRYAEAAQVCVCVCGGGGGGLGCAAGGPWQRCREPSVSVLLRRQVARTSCSPTAPAPRLLSPPSCPLIVCA